MSTDEFDVTVTAAYKTPGRRLNNFTATTGPVGTDDATDLYEVGSVWVDTVAGVAYICVDPTEGAAVWTELSGGGGSDDQTASEVPFTPAGTIAATDVQAAIEEVSGDVGDHTADTSDAHDASAISVLDTAANFIGTDVEAVLAELAGMVVGADWRDPTTLLSDLTASGATSIDRDDAATHYLELAGNLTLTPTDSAPPGAGFCIDMRALILGDGSSTLAFGGTITWATEGGTAPSAPGDGELLTIGFLSIDDATTWLGFVAEGGGTAVGALDDLTDVTITAAAEGDFLRHNGTAWVDSPLTAADVQAPGHYELLMVGSGPPEPLEDGTGTDWLYVWVTG